MNERITDEQFAALPWTEQCTVLREFLNRSCEQSGRTRAEADRKRAPINKRMFELQHIHDQQRTDWIAEVRAVPQ